MVSTERIALVALRHATVVGLLSAGALAYSGEGSSRPVDQSGPAAARGSGGAADGECIPLFIGTNLEGWTVSPGADPQLQSRGVRLDLPHSRAGTVPSVANPIRFSETPLQYRSGPPVLGEHTAEVLQRVLGADDAALAAWSRQNVIKDTRE